MNWPESIQTGDFGHGLSDDIKSRLAELAEPRSFSSGAVIFQEGSLHHAVHLIVQGRAQLDITIAQRGRIPILTVGPGDLLGWSPVFGQSPMTATATALDAVESLAIPGDALRRLCETEPQVGMVVMRQLALALARRLVATRLQLCNVVL